MARGAKSGYSMTPAESAEPKPAYEPFDAAPLEWDEQTIVKQIDIKDMQLVQEVEK